MSDTSKAIKAWEKAHGRSMTNEEQSIFLDGFLAGGLVMFKSAITKVEAMV